MFTKLIDLLCEIPDPIFNVLKIVAPAVGGAIGALITLEFLCK